MFVQANFLVRKFEIQKINRFNIETTQQNFVYGF